MQKTLTQKLTLTGTGLLAVFALAACGGTGDTEAGDSISLQPNESTSSAPAQSGASGTADDADDRNDDQDDARSAAASGSSASGSAASGSAQGSSAGGSDPAFAAIDAVTGALSGATVISLDRDDDDTTWDVKAVDGQEVVDFDVTQDGKATETERETDKDDVDEAGRAKVAVADALTTALKGRDGQTVDDVDLDEENGTLVWKIDFDDAAGHDADEVHVDATTGDIVKG